MIQAQHAIAVRIAIDRVSSAAILWPYFNGALMGLKQQTFYVAEGLLEAALAEDP